MGVRGLTTYIAANADQYLDPFELHDCNVVIDGDSLSCQLYKSINSAFGGNYDNYFRIICNFFEMLKRCNVTAYVLLDGGYQPKKLNTVKQRLRSKIGAIKHLNPFECQPTFPIMMREVFVEAMEHCQISFMRCLFEADDEVAALSRKLKCPVLSFDSDFYIHNVIYIPTVTLTLKVFRRNLPSDDGGKKVSQRKKLVSEFDLDGEYRDLTAQKKPSADADSATKNCYYYMQCSMYRIANLAREKRLRAEMLPLFAILLGNDYISSSIFKKFFLNVSMKNTGKNNTKQGKRILALLRWLQHETLASAIDRIINHVEKEKKEWLREQINIGIAGYIHERSMAYDYFGFSDKAAKESIGADKMEKVDSAAQELEFQPDTQLSSDGSDEDNLGKSDSECGRENVTTDQDHQDGIEVEPDDIDGNSEESESEDENQSDDDSESESEDSEADQQVDRATDPRSQWPVVTSFHPPDWIHEKILSGRMPRFIVDLMTLRLYINAPQVENFEKVDCNRISVPILQLIFTLLHRPYHREFRYLTRVTRRTDIEYRRYESLRVSTEFNPNSSENFDFFKLVLDDFENAEAIFTAINEHAPPELRLFFIAIIYWSRYSVHFNVVYVSSLVLCQIVLTVIDSKVSPIRNRLKFDRMFNPKAIKKANAKKPEELQPSIETCMAQITQNECILAQSNFLDLFLVSDKLRTKHTDFSSDIIHGFAEFQAIVYQLNCLNVLCGEPYANVEISKCFNGCFLYNTYVTLKERPNIKYYIQKFLLADSVNLFELYESMMSVLTPFVECLSQETISKRKKRRNINKKRSREQRKNTLKPDDHRSEDATKNSANEQSGSDFEDLNNKFSCLMKN